MSFSGVQWFSDGVFSSASEQKSFAKTKSAIEAAGENTRKLGKAAGQAVQPDGALTAWIKHKNEMGDVKKIVPDAGAANDSATPNSGSLESLSVDNNV